MCKYYKSGIFNDHCTAKNKDEKVTYEHAKKYCQRCSQYEECNTWKEIAKGGFFGGFWR